MSAGPFATEAEVHDAIGWRARGAYPTCGDNELALFAACQTAGVELGAYDRRILSWLATSEPQTCAVIAGLILRASA